MNARENYRHRLWLLLVVVLAECAHLAWEHVNGGIISHNVLNRADLPAISNAWGLFLLPALTWFLSGFALRRNPASSAGSATVGGLPASVVVGFAGALTFGIALAASFTYGHEAASSFLFIGMFALALVVRVYRAECVLGFVLGMTFTFGAVLPTAVASIIAAVSAAAHLVVWPRLARLAGRFRPAS